MHFLERNFVLFQHLMVQEQAPWPNTPMSFKWGQGCSVWQESVLSPVDPDHIPKPERPPKFNLAILPLKNHDWKTLLLNFLNSIPFLRVEKTVTLPRGLMIFFWSVGFPGVIHHHQASPIAWSWGIKGLVTAHFGPVCWWHGLRTKTSIRWKQPQKTYGIHTFSLRKKHKVPNCPHSKPPQKHCDCPLKTACAEIRFQFQIVRLFFAGFFVKEDVSTQETPKGVKPKICISLSILQLAPTKNDSATKLHIVGGHTS